jgi:hypothetical protein
MTALEQIESLRRATALGPPAAQIAKNDKPRLSCTCIARMTGDHRFP